MNDSPATPDGDRLAKVMARAGLCSRRDAEEWIKAGRVAVNGRKVMTPAFNVSASDQVTVDGEPLSQREGTRVWLYHKPRGLVVTEKDPEGRPTIFESLAEKGLPRVLSVGRLDINTEGLLLLTNDGGLKRVLELPATGWLRKYRVRAHGTITQPQLDALRQGVEVDGIKYGPIEATLERDQGANVWLELALREGKNREVKNVLGALGLEVNRLIRISFGPFQLGDLPIGAVEVVKARVLKDQLGKRLADEAEVDFTASMPEETAGAHVRGPAKRGRPAPAEERTYGRGTHTTTIARQRFRFTDRAEMTPAEAEARRLERPRRDRPGSNSPPPRGPRPGAKPFGRADETAPVRRIHFDDGREPTVFEEKTYGKKPARGAPAGREDGVRRARRT
ncbi:MAG: pseudouridine synthase, partial [Devosia sp.]|nr:pseudouridine synthase [Devosia sp.]